MPSSSFLVGSYRVGETEAENFLELHSRAFMPRLVGNLDLVVVNEVSPQRCLEVFVENIICLDIPVNHYV